MLDRWVNIFYSLTLIFVFILFGDAQDHVQILTGLLLAFSISSLAFIINWLTYDGSVSATIFGAIAYGFGGFLGAAVVMTFFISASLISKDMKSDEDFMEKKYRRNGSQVWANGFWFCFWMFIWFLTGYEPFMIASVVSVAASASDTWSTEIGGNRVQGDTRLISSFEKVEPGTEGGVSFWGTLAGFAGAMSIAAVYWLFRPDTLIWPIIIITLSGFLGCIVDSYLGARHQNSYLRFRWLNFIDKERLFIGNNFVNWVSAGIASIISLVSILII